MPIETVKTTIESDSYQITKLGAIQGRGVLLRLVKALGPSFAEAAKGAELPTLIASAIEGIKESDFEFICDLLAQHTRIVRGEKAPLLSDQFDAHFSGRYGAMIAWLIEALRVNFENFFEEVQTLLPKKQAAPERGGSASKSPMESTGQSGEF